ncbi:MAG: CopG family transcriptional regulator [Candidatus Binatia bacterium]
MNRTRKPAKPVSAEAIAKQAEQGKDVSTYFTNTGQMMLPVQRVNIDFSQEMLNELDTTARELNISRQAVIKAFLRQALDQHYLARQARRAA